MRVCAYARCSTEYQEDSPEVQLAIIRAYCEREGHTVVAEYVDEAVSGKHAIATRPAAKRMLEDAKAKKFEAIVVKQLDRLGRNAADSISFPEKAKKLGVRLLFVQESFADTPAGRIHYGMLALLAQYYREDIGQKIRDANIHKARQGRWVCGTAALGLRYNKDKKCLEVDEQRVQDINTVFETYIKLGGNQTGTCRALNSLGILGNGGGFWNTKQIAAVIGNPIYLGVIKFKEFEQQFDESIVPRVVPEEMVLQAQKFLASTKGRRVRGSGKFVYTPVLYCARCGAKISGTRHANPPKDKSDYYACHRHSKMYLCDAPQINEARLDRLVLPAIKRLLLMHADDLVKQKSGSGHNKNADQQRKSLEQKRSRYVDMCAAGVITIEEAHKHTTEIDKHLADLLVRPVTPIIVMDQELLAVVNDLELHWPEMSFEEKRSFLLSVTPRVIINPGRQATAEIHSPLSHEPIITTDTLGKST